MRDDRERVLDMLQAVERIERYVAVGRDAFSADDVGQVWVVHHLEILGEAARGLSGELRTAHPEVPWPTIVAMRNVLVHHYFEVDVERVWGTMERDLPPLRSQLEAIAAELGYPARLNPPLQAGAGLGVLWRLGVGVSRGQPDRGDHREQRQARANGYPHGGHLGWRVQAQPTFHLY